MVDVLTPDQRRLNMSRIHGRDTKPEMLLRSGLHRLGFRFRLHDRRLPGSPDLVLPRYKTVVFIHGCFWHAHGCKLSGTPDTRKDFWQKKLTGNASRDVIAVNNLQQSGWHVLTIWECALRGPGRYDLTTVLQSAARYIKVGRRQSYAIAGT